MSDDPTQLGSLLEGIDQDRPKERARRSLRDRLNRAGNAALAWPLATRRRRLVSGAAVALGLIGAGVFAYLESRPTPVPDYDTDPIDTLFDFTLLTDEFNRLSVEERLELLGTLYRRMEGMSASESVLLAAFAAQIEGQLRDQVEENISRLMFDTADMLAVKYQQLPSDADLAERQRALEDAYVEFVRLGGVFDGRPVTTPREEILQEGREEAQEREAQIASRQSTLRQADWVFNTVQTSAEQFSTPQQRSRVTRFMRDMTRHLRGEDIKSGEKISTPQPPAPGGG